MLTSRQRWFAELLYAGLETKVLTEDDVLHHVTPTVLSAALPKDILVKVFDAALASGTMSSKAILQIVTPELMAQYTDAVVWTTISTAAKRIGIVDANGAAKDDPNAREFLRRGLAAGLVSNAVTPKDIVDQVNAKVIGTTFPDVLTAKLLDASLASGKMTPDLVVEVIGVDALAKHPPMPVLWAIFSNVAQAGAKQVDQKAPTKQALEVLEDDMPSITVEPTPPTPAPTPAVKPAAKSAPAKA